MNDEHQDQMRLNKYISHSGVCARRQAADYVKKGLVKVNNITEHNPGYIVQPGDKVTLKEKLIQPEIRKIYLLMNKPKNVITTANDEKGRATVLDIVGKKIKERVYPVGRLDRMTSGLLLLTNDGELAQRLTHPSFRVKKIYYAVLDKILPITDLEKIRRGVQLDDGPATLDGIDYAGEKKNELGIVLHSGRNRIIRRIFELLNYKVVKLDRTYYAGLTKKDLPRGRFRQLTQKEVIMLKHFTR